MEKPIVGDSRCRRLTKRAGQVVDFDKDAYKQEGGVTREEIVDGMGRARCCAAAQPVGLIRSGGGGKIKGEIKLENGGTVIGIQQGSYETTSEYFCHCENTVIERKKGICARSSTLKIPGLLLGSLLLAPCSLGRRTPPA
jgi:hypothetical protein